MDRDMLSPLWVNAIAATIAALAAVASATAAAIVAYYTWRRDLRERSFEPAATHATNAAAVHIDDADGLLTELLAIIREYAGPLDRRVLVNTLIILAAPFAVVLLASVFQFYVTGVLATIAYFACPCSKLRNAGKA
jgi:hypothetical protein